MLLIVGIVVRGEMRGLAIGARPLGLLSATTDSESVARLHEVQVQQVPGLNLAGLSGIQSPGSR